MKWSWEYTVGRSDPSADAARIDIALPPKAGMCTVLFNPFYKLIFIKNTKVAGTSVFLNFGGGCKETPTLADAQVPPSPVTHRVPRVCPRNGVCSDHSVLCEHCVHVCCTC